jgi:hypothetical protein
LNKAEIFYRYAKPGGRPSSQFRRPNKAELVDMLLDELDIDDIGGSYHIRLQQLPKRLLFILYYAAKKRRDS